MIILASGSPRRQELLKYITTNFEVIVGDIEENLDLSQGITKAIEKLSLEKANHVFQQHQDAVVIGADTVVVLDQEILGKPKDHKDAFKMLSKLSGETHDVITAVTIISKEKKLTFSVITEVKFYYLSPNQINNYIINCQPFDKAGGYAIQDDACLFVESINGDYNNIVGLPISRLNQELNKFLGI